jgi:hypothetical protein
MTDNELEGTVIPGTRGPIKERADGTLTCMLVIQPKDKPAFLKLLPDVDLPVFIVRQDPRHAQQQMRDKIVEEEGKRGIFGTQAKALRLHVDWMGNPEVWAVVGSDSQYLEWCRLQPCAHCKDPAPSEAAHVRRVANGAGMAIKPDYSAIPLCRRCHASQHQTGESAIGGKERVNQLRMRYVHQWVWERMRAIFKVESMSAAAPALVFEWAREHDIEKFLPECYRG